MEEIYSAAFLSCSDKSLTDDEKRLFEKFRPAGITLFSRNIDNIKQLQKLIKQIREIVGYDILVAVDQEGGRVRRLKEPDFFPYVAQTKIGELPLKLAKKAAKLHAELISYDLKKVGIDVNFAPVLDVMHADTTDALRSRCFSDDVDVVSELAKLSVDSYIESGIIPCIKHLPGHGRAACDPHLGLPVIEAKITELADEFRPFQICNYAPMGMTAHILLTDIDKNYPITQSKTGINKIIREMIGFNGFLISDAIDMNALRGDIVQRAEASLAAGCDSVCYCMGRINEMYELSKYCPKLSDEAMLRLDKAKEILHNNLLKGVTKKREQYSAIFSEITAYNEKYDATEVLHKMQRES